MRERSPVVPIRCLRVTPALLGRVGFGVVLAIVTSACAPRAAGPARAAPAGALPPSSSAAPAAVDDVQRGKATYYGEKFRGRKTASGARFNPDELTAAHRTLRFGTRVEVRRPDTGDSVQVTITDRGPFGHPDRVIDLSLAAARRLQMTKLGVVDVEIRVLRTP